jgi:hypothetical protein
MGGARSQHRHRRLEQQYAHDHPRGEAARP